MATKKKYGKEIPETHWQGRISFEQDIKQGMIEDGDIGIQVSRDGKVWICLGGASLIRLYPKLTETS